MSDVVKHESFIEALAAAQSEFEAIPKTRTGRKGNQEYKYAPLEVVLEKTLPHLNKHGIAATWYTERNDLGLDVVTKLEGWGDARSCFVPLYFEGDMKSLGSAITYARRYGYQCVTGCIAEEDDDGTAAGTPKQGASSQASATTSPPKSAGPPTFDQWKEWITLKTDKGPEVLLEFVNRAFEGEQLNADKPLLKKVIGEAGRQVEAKLQAGKWTEEQTTALDARLLEMMKSFEPTKQKELV